MPDLIDMDYSARNGSTVWVGAEPSQLPLKPIGQSKVVCVVPGHELGGARFETNVKCVHNPAIRLVE